MQRKNILRPALSELRILISVITLVLSEDEFVIKASKLKLVQDNRRRNWEIGFQFFN